ncbi:hypothetical protein [Legionella feeleii]|uniref:Uncharacterized protein n=1 Tax=Legionella feeleii TaxID=453 RepID=A0A0W0TMQ3_9GAMM|nr:hypothetical protein [Legionella feeleii]KTC96864.1 hypothetical protein Lfee_1776 [Legionella feeleii]SPX60902.1 Uncharacterised protein [Legionella feeleii]
MNKDITRYKVHFVTVALLLSYAYIHTALTGVYTEAPLTELIDFSVRLPYGQRILVPALAHFLAYILPLEVDQLFFLLEWLFVSLFYYALTKLLAYEFEPRAAQLLSWLFILLLPLITVINFRFNSDGDATFFYPCDSAALFFMATGFLFCLRAQWFYLIPWVFLATFNRESSILLVLLIPALYWQHPRTIFKPLVFAIFAYLLARFLIVMSLQDIPGQLMEWYFRGSSSTYFEVNLLWLFNEQNIFLFIFCFAGLPLFWFAFYDFIPTQYRPIRYVSLCYFLGLLLVGSFMEARIFSEIIILLYLPVCVAIRCWLISSEPNYAPVRNFAYYLNRYSVLAILIVVLLFSPTWNKLVIWLSHHSY